ncbi:hypothetical protein PG996_006431 [Apiospora saccharicola]|uniref:Uncharacterized protein n=1 Tax=Apiospora saccharicola TaxID=335842 RepID=A0ABR1VTD6_9PEZI
MFVAQDIGGLMLKDILHMAMQGVDSRDDISIMTDTVGIIFIDTPHYGMRFAKRLRSTLWVLSQPGLASTRVLEPLSPGSDMLRELINRFREVLNNKDIPIYSCHSTKTGVLFDMIIESHEVVLLFASEEVVPLRGGHKDITKMPGPGDPNLITIHGIFDRTRDRVSKPRRESRTRKSTRSAISQSPNRTRSRSPDRVELPKVIDPSLFPAGIAVILPAGKSSILPAEVDMITPWNMITADALKRNDLYKLWYPRRLGEITTLRLEYRYCYREGYPSPVQTKEFHVDHTNSLRAPVLLAFDHLRGLFSVPRKQDGLDPSTTSRTSTINNYHYSISNPDGQAAQSLKRGSDPESPDASRTWQSLLSNPPTFPPADQSFETVPVTVDKNTTAISTASPTALGSMIGDILPRGIEAAAASGMTTSEIATLVTATVAALTGGVAASASVGNAINSGRSANIQQETLDMAKEKREEEKREKGKALPHSDSASGVPGPSSHLLKARPNASSSPSARAGTAKVSSSKATDRAARDLSKRLEWLDRIAPVPRHDPDVATSSRSNRSRDGSTSPGPPGTVIPPRGGGKSTNAAPDPLNADDDGSSFEETNDAMKMHQIGQPGDRTSPPRAGEAQAKESGKLTGLDARYTAKQGANVDDSSSNIEHSQHANDSYVEDDGINAVDSASVPTEPSVENQQLSKSATEATGPPDAAPDVAAQDGDKPDETGVELDKDMEEALLEDCFSTADTSDDAYGPVSRMPHESLGASDQPATTDDSLPDESSELPQKTDTGAETISSQDAVPVDMDSGSRGEDGEGSTKFPSPSPKSSVSGEEAILADTPIRQPSPERLPEHSAEAEEKIQIEQKNEGVSANGAGEEIEQGGPAEPSEGENAAISVEVAATDEMQALDHVSVSEGSPKSAAGAAETPAVEPQAGDDQAGSEDGRLQQVVPVEQPDPDFDDSASDGKHEAPGQLDLGKLDVEELEYIKETGVGRGSAILRESVEKDRPSKEFT